MQSSERSKELLTNPQILRKRKSIEQEYSPAADDFDMQSVFTEQEQVPLTQTQILSKLVEHNLFDRKVHAALVPYGYNHINRA